MKQIQINLKNNSYSCLIKKGIFQELDKYLDFSKENIILTDSKVYDLYLKSNQLKLPIIVVQEGEESKSLATYQKVIERLLELKVSKDATLIAIGGGVIGDLAGFVACTYLRGIKLIQIPTTLLAQIDSSVGGKVAINIGKVKNSVGQFYHPSLVLIDPLFLETLELRQFNNGMAEVIKYGLIADSALFSLLETKQALEHIEELIYRSLMIKKRFVEGDEKDSYLRHTLNFGHTIGHALEAFYDFDKYLHGEAIAIGMAQMTKDEVFSPRVINSLRKFNLPTSDEVKKKDLLPFITNDKKVRHEKINIVLLEQIGKAYIKKIDLKNIEKYLGE